MPKLGRPGLALRIIGAENVRGSITQWRTTTRERIFAVLERNTPDAVEHMRDQMRAAYPWGGKTAESITGEVGETNVGGPVVRIALVAYREVKYLTTLLPESDFRAGKYEIPLVPSGKMLSFYWQREKKWFSGPKVTHPGFGRQGDVLRRSGEQALGWLGISVEQEVRSAVAELQSGGRTYSLSRRR